MNTSYHKHHIKPRSCGGTNDPDNLVQVTVEEHAKIHHSLWVLGGRWQDKIAWLSLSKQIGKEEIQKEICRHIGLSNKGKPSPRKGKVSPLKGRKVGPYSAERVLKVSAALKGRPNPRKGQKTGPLTVEHKAKISKACQKPKPWLKGRTPWNKGLTKENDQRVADNTKIFGKYTRTAEHRKNQSDFMKGNQHRKRT